ncbi:MAG: transposase, partial [Clostridiales bacterium]|nr:transposase [Clostridiales bacterium]
MIKIMYIYYPKLVKVDRFFASSQICSECGCKNNEVRNFGIRSWICPDCGKYHDRDTN